MSGAFTLKFDGWAPDLQNVAMEVDGSSGTVPCADCLNVYYQDASFRCLPGPNPYAPSLGLQALNLFSGYDNISANNYLYAAMANGIAIYQNGVWLPVPVEPSVSVTLTGLALGFTTGGAGAIGATVTLTGLRMAMTTGGAFFSTGTVGTSGGAIFSGTLTAGNKSAGLGGNVLQIGYVSGAYGSLSPSALYSGTQVQAIQTTTTPTGATTNVIINGTIPQSYFTKLSIPSIGVNLATAAVSQFIQSSGQTTWQWTGSIGLTSGNSYAVKFIQ